MHHLYPKEKHLPLTVVLRKLVNDVKWRICYFIKQNASEVGKDMLLVSLFFLRISKIYQKYLKPDTCEPLQYYGLHMFTPSM